MKPGTRCECRSLGCDSINMLGENEHEPVTCSADAVRMVTVPDGSPKPGRMFPIKDIPMCASCAAYRESRGAK